MEGAYAILTGNVVAFSEQQLMDCAKSQYDLACKGGWPFRCFEYYLKNKPMKQEDYPYLSRKSTCNYNAAKGVDINTEAYVEGTKNSVSSLKQAVAHQPIAGALAAYNPAFMNYKGGILNDPSCGQSVNHAVLIVGYGKDAQTGQEFWLIRNSWDTTWGEEGYIRLAITGDGPGMCAIQTQLYWPLVKTGDGKKSKDSTTYAAEIKQAQSGQAG